MATQTQTRLIRIFKREKGKVVPVEGDEFDRLIDVISTIVDQGLCRFKVLDAILYMPTQFEYLCEYMEWQLRCHNAVPFIYTGNDDEEIPLQCTLTNGRDKYEIEYRTEINNVKL